MNSQYTGEQVESLLTQVSGKTIYTQGDGITISDEGVISSTGGGGTGDLSAYTTTDNFESASEAIAKSLVDAKAERRELYATFKSYYTKDKVDSLLAGYTTSGDVLTTITSFNYITNDKHEEFELIIAAALVDLDSRLSAIESKETTNE